MAIHDTNVAATPAAAAPAAAQPSMAYQAPEQKDNGPTQFSFHMASIIDSPISENPGDDALINLDTALSKALSASKDRMEFHTIRMDRGTKMGDGDLAFSMLVVVGSLKGLPKAAAYHTLILEITGDALKPRIHNYSGENIEEYVAVSAAYDAIATRMIETAIRAKFGNIDLFSADSMVVPSTFNTTVAETDEAARNRVQRLAANVALAIAAELQTRQTSFQGLNMRNWTRDSQLVVTPRFERVTIRGVDELPRRQDIRIELSSQQLRNNNVQNQSVNNGDRTVAISEISAFVDLIWSPDQKNQQMHSMMMPQPNMPKQLYAANIIVTNVTSGKIPTIGGTLLALAGIRSVTEQNNWYGSFRSSGMRNAMADIGYLNLEANIENNPSGQGQPLDTSVDTFTSTDLVRYLNNIVRPGAIVSMDVPESGPESWSLAAFSIAASSHEMSRQAQMAIYHQAQVLTGGSFGQYFNENDKMFDNTGNRVHMGHFTDQQGAVRDIRDIDYVAIAAMSKDLDQITAWSDTYSALQMSLLARLARRKRIMSALVGADNAKITGYANRVTFTQHFLDALTKSLQSIGVTPRLDSNAFGLATVDRGVANWVDSALFNPQGGGYFSQGSGMMGGISTYNPYTTARF